MSVKWAFCLGLSVLIHWGQDKMTISQMKFSNVKFLKDIWILINVSLKFIPKSDNGLARPRRQAIIWTSDGKFTDAYMPHSAPMR